MAPITRQRTYWRAVLRLTAALLLIWFVVTFAVSFYARELNAITFFGFPLGFYMSGQGALLIYVLIVGYYARRMNALDESYVARHTDRSE